MDTRCNYFGQSNLGATGDEGQRAQRLCAVKDTPVRNAYLGLVH